MANLELTALTSVQRLALRRVLPESDGARLRRLARAAERQNPIAQPPLTIAAAWAPSTAYAAYQVVSNGGRLYACVVGGTSAASGGPSHTSAQALTDGSVTWSYVGHQSIAADDPEAPAVSITTSTPSASLPNIYYPATGPDVFAYRGGYPTTVYGTAVMLKTFSQAAGNAIDLGAGVEFMTDAPRFAISTANGTPIRIRIDGRFLTPGAMLSGAGYSWFVLDFSAAGKGGRKMRRIAIDGLTGADLYFGSVAVGAGDQVMKPPRTDGVRAAFVSDSILAGSSYGPFLPGADLAERVAHLLGWSDPWNCSTGGTGYIASAGNTRFTFGQRVPELLARNPDVWMLMGSTNDRGQSAAAITAAVLSTLQAIRAGSQAPIIVAGVLSIDDTAQGAGGKNAVLEGAVQAAVTAFADPRCFFVPLSTDPVLPWVTGSWNNAVLPSSVTAAQVISGDGTHPSDIGTAYLAERLARAIRETVLPELA